jgi:hypothetical protein
MVGAEGELGVKSRNQFAASRYRSGTSEPSPGRCGGLVRGVGVLVNKLSNAPPPRARTAIADQSIRHLPGSVSRSVRPFDAPFCFPRERVSSLTGS